MKPIEQVGANQFIESKIEECHSALEQRTQADVIAFFGPLLQPIDNLIRACVEQIRSSGTRKNKLVVVIETSGGSAEVAQRIAETFRQHYRRVEFIVPNHAMSAGTLLVMSGDAIHMDYYSVLGPIDPQIMIRNRGWVPALGYLAKYEKLLEKANLPGGLNTAEMALLINAFDQAELYQFEQARNLSITLLKDWLVRYKFKSWKKTQTRKLPVTKAMKVARAEQIAKILNDSDRWHTHGRGISMTVLRKDLKLLIDDFGKDKELDKVIRVYYGLLADYVPKLGASNVIQARGVFVPFM